MSKFKLPSQFKTQSTSNAVSEMRMKLRMTNDEVCMKVAKNMRDAAIEELILNYNTANHFWQMTCAMNSHSTKEELGPQFARAQWIEWASSQATAAIAYCVLQLLGGNIASTAKSFMSKK